MSKYATSDGYKGFDKWPGLVEPGNLDLSKRPVVNMPNGGYGTEYSTTIDDGKHAVLIPTIYNGALHTQDEAIKQYKDTGQHMGKFDLSAEQSSNPPYANSEAYANQLHNRPMNIQEEQDKGTDLPTNLQTLLSGPPLKNQ